MFINYLCPVAWQIVNIIEIWFSVMFFQIGKSLVQYYLSCRIGYGHGHGYGYAGTVHGYAKIFWAVGYGIGYVRTKI